MNDRKQKLDEGCFAGAVGPEQAVSDAGLDLEGDAVHGADQSIRPEAAEVLGQARGFDDRGGHGEKPADPPQKARWPCATSVSTNGGEGKFQGIDDWVIDD